MDALTIDVEHYLNSLGVVLRSEDHWPVRAEEDELKHYGTPRRSGRYPWGSGGDEASAAKRNRDFLDNVNVMKKQGMSEKDIAQGLGISINQLRTAKSIAKNAEKQANIDMARRLSDKGWSNGAIAERLNLAGESSVRALLAEGVKDKADVLQATADMLKAQVDKHEFIDVGASSELHIGVSRQKLDTAIALLKEQGYAVHNVQEDQIGTGAGNKTLIKVLAPPGTQYRDIVTQMEKIHPITDFTEDGGRSYFSVQPPLSISSKRVGIKYDEDGGSQADGVIYVRPGVHDVSIGNARYAQVRIAVDGTHYLKGMAVYKDDLPDGVDLMFNTNKSNTGNKLDAMKSIKDDPENPFGATIRQRIDPRTGKVTSAMNIVGHKEGSGEEGSWETWSRNLPSQFLSKQSHQLAKQQLDLTAARKRDELDDILALTNPAVKRKLLDTYADGADSASVHLKAAAMPRQSTHVILPVNSLKETEVYAPNFQNGERVALVRFPHGGTFEIPELTVNNNHAPAVKLLGKQARDAIGINHKVAERLSGADFDGDTVLVIPNNSGKVQSRPALQGLKDFDPKREYPPYDGMKTMDGGTWSAAEKKVVFPEGKKPNSRTKGFEMGNVSNLITDMTIRGATDDELARAVRHSMVVIDAEKHALNYKESARQNNITQLKEKYQGVQRADGKKNMGAATLISRASSRQDVRKRKARPAKDGGPIDPTTGKKMWVETGDHWIDSKGKVHYKTDPSTKLAETDDAFTLSSGTRMEAIYATHSNAMKALANEARLASYNTKSTPYSPSAKKAYAPQVQRLNDALKKAQMNRPRERQAQIIANAALRAKKAENPHMDADQLKKVKFQELAKARMRTGAGKDRIYISDEEWSAIQAGAITTSKLKDILDNADLDRVRELATPKRDVLMTSSKKNKAETMARLGYTQAEIADALGVSVTTLKRSLG